MQMELAAGTMVSHNTYQWWLQAVLNVSKDMHALSIP